MPSIGPCLEPPLRGELDRQVKVSCRSGPLGRVPAGQSRPSGRRRGWPPRVVGAFRHPLRSVAEPATAVRSVCGACVCVTTEEVSAVLPLAPERRASGVIREASERQWLHGQRRDALDAVRVSGRSRLRTGDILSEQGVLSTRRSESFGFRGAGSVAGRPGGAGSVLDCRRGGFLYCWGGGRVLCWAAVKDWWSSFV